MRDPQRRNGRQAEQLGGFHPAMAGDDLAGIVDEHRIDKTETLDAVGD